MNGTSEEDAKGNLANLDLAYLISYAGFMFVSGWVAERMDLRYFLSGGWSFFVFTFELDFEGGMILSGVVTFFFGFAYTAGIHSFGYLIGMQVGWFCGCGEKFDCFYLCGNLNVKNQSLEGAQWGFPVHRVAWGGHSCCQLVWKRQKVSSLLSLFLSSNIC